MNKLTNRLTTLALALGISSALASHPVLTYNNDETPVATDEILLQQTPEEYDSLVAQWYAQNTINSHEEFFKLFVDIDSTATIPNDTPDSVYIARLKMIVSPIQLPYNDIIKRYIVAYTGRNKDVISRVLGRSQVYFPMIEQELDKNDMPIELRMLPVIESALNPNAVSRAGATGLWQFMYTTGKHYGLEVTSFIDQRRDPVLATRAAIRFMKDLYNIYGDWTLVLAAYNCGPGNVNKAIKRAGGEVKTFWDIYPYLPQETRGYIPSFIAATYAYTFHQLHGIEPVEAPVSISTDTVCINRLMHFEQVSSTLEMPIETIRELNPQYKMDIIPAQDRVCFLRLPQNDITKYIENEDVILSKDTLFLAQYLQKDPVTLKKEFTVTSTTYKVKKGDTLGAIAKKHGTTVSQIMKWNNLKSANTLRIGQSLQIYR